MSYTELDHLCVGFLVRIISYDDGELVSEVHTYITDSLETPESQVTIIHVIFEPIFFITPIFIDVLGTSPPKAREAVRRVVLILEVSIGFAFFKIVGIQTLPVTNTFTSLE